MDVHWASVSLTHRHGPERLKATLFPELRALRCFIIFRVSTPLPSPAFYVILRIRTIRRERMGRCQAHARHMVGGRAPNVTNELLYRFEFPESPGALSRFLAALSGGWNVSLFHYRNHGHNFGRVLAGLEVSQPCVSVSRLEICGVDLGCGQAAWRRCEGGGQRYDIMTIAGSRRWIISC